MKLPFWILAAAALAAGSGDAQTLGNTALSGKYYFVHLLVTAAGGQASGAQNLSGSISFSGDGAYSYTGELAAGSGAPAQALGFGTYSVQPSGTVILKNPIVPALQIAARLSGDRNVLLGASTEAADNTNDLFVAVKAPTTALTNAVFNGSYTGVSLELPGGKSTAMRTAWIALAPAGNGKFAQVTVSGHAVDQGSVNVSQSASGSTYSVNSDGTGSANFGGAATLLSGTRELFFSPDGSTAIGDATAAGARGVFVATRNAGSTASSASLNGRYWIAELTMQSQASGSCSNFDFEGASGAFQSYGNGTAVFSERIHVDTHAIDFTGLNAYSVSAGGTGELGPFLQGITNIGMGTQAVVGAQIGAPNTTSCTYGVFLAARAPTFTASGSAPFVDPAGVVNTASFAPFPNPASPGGVMSLFGANLASSTVAASNFPLLNSLGGVTVTANGLPAPLYYVSPTQINIQVPFESSGSSVSIVVTNNGMQSNPVLVPLSATSPGLFQYTDGSDGNRAVAQHVNGTLISSASPATVGETIVLYAVGMGALQPAVASGAANPASPAALVADTHVTVLIGGEIAPNVQFLGGAPGYPGLYQINVQIPATVLPGTNVPVEIVTSNADCDVVDIPIGM